MRKPEPLDDQAVEAELHDLVTRIIGARERAETRRGKKLLSIALTGPLGALMHDAKIEAGKQAVDDTPGV